MKNALFILFAVMLFSCAKDYQPDIPTPAPVTLEKKAVRFSLDDFIRQESDMRKSARNASGHGDRDTSLANIAYIYYVAYDNNGMRVSFVKQDSLANAADFGAITDSLVPGNYTIVLAATTKPVTFNADTADSPTQPDINYHVIQPLVEGGAGVLNNGDIFLKKFPLEVAPNTGSIAIDISLNRIVGKIAVQILDALPTSHPYYRLWVRVNPTTFSYKLSNGIVSAPAGYFDRWMNTLSYNSFEDYLFGSSHLVNVTIDYLDKTTGAELQKVITNVPVTSNKITRIKGYLFGAPAPNASDYQIKVNQAWDSDVTEIEL